MDDETVGEVVARGNVILKGYWRQPEETAKVIVDGWFHTGDLGYLDEDGFLFIVGRKKDMIISGGLNVYPREAEEIIYRYGSIAEAAVVGVPDDKWGEVAVAVIVPGPDGIDEPALAAACREHLASYKCPRAFLVHDEPLPRNTAGKVLKRLLRPWAEEQLRAPVTATTPEVPSA
jgi:long-chain acyl-CoA synthetase